MALMSSASASPSLSPSRRAWLRFKRNRLGYWSLLIFCALVLVSLCAELVSNDKPLIVRYEGQTYFPMLKDYSEKTFGGDFETPTDYLDPFIKERITAGSNWALYTLNPYGPNTLNYFAKSPNPSAPTADNWLGTDDRGRDLLAQLLYGFRVSVLFGLALTITGVLLGMLTGAIQGFFGGKTDLAFQRFIEIWGSMPELYLLIIFSAVFAPSIALLLILLSLFGWMGLSDYVRAEFLRNRQLDYVKAARALGVSNSQIIWRHILPNSLTPVITFLPFRMSAAIMALASLDFLGLGVTAPDPSLGLLLLQGKETLSAWWIAVSAFGTLVLTLLFFFAWFACYFIELWLLRHLPLGILRYPLGLVVIAGAFVLAAPLCAAICRPLRPLFHKVEAISSKSVLGQVAVVRSGRVTTSHGEAVLEDGGAGLILRVRADEALGFKRGDRVVLLEYLAAEHAYRIITEEEFRGV